MPGPIRNVVSSVNEAVVAPTKDEVGKMIEQGVSQAMGQSSKPVDPQVEIKKRQDDQRKRMNILQFLRKYESDRQSLGQQRLAEQQKKQAEEQAEQQKKMQVKQIEVVKKQQTATVAQQQAKAKAERKGGVGG